MTKLAWFGIHRKGPNGKPRPPLLNARTDGMRKGLLLEKRPCRLRWERHEDDVGAGLSGPLCGGRYGLALDSFSRLKWSWKHAFALAFAAIWYLVGEGRA